MMFIVPGLAMVFFGLRHVARGRASPEWPTTSGVVQSSSIKQRRQRDGSFTYYPIVAYSYEVGGVVHTGHQSGTAQLSTTAPRVRKQTLTDMQRGRRYRSITVLADPGNPYSSQGLQGMRGYCLLLEDCSS
jgi:hypothetical protein